MVTDDQRNVQGAKMTPGAGRSGLLREVGLALAIVAVGGIGLFVYRWLRPADDYAVSAANEDKARPAAKTPPLFHRWPADRKPEVVLLLTGQTHGFLKFCGCSTPQYGGFPRRYNFIEKELKGRGWPVVPLDLGDVAQAAGPQTKLKYVYSMRALKKLGYPVTAIGENEFALPLQDGLANFHLNEGKPPYALAANLKDTQGAFFGCVQSHYVTKEESPVKIGVIGIVGPSVIKQVRDPAAKFEATQQVLPQLIRDIGQAEPRLEMLVLLYQGNTLDEATALAKAYPQFSVILALSLEEEPREDPIKVVHDGPGDKPPTLIINVGHKGRKVGVLGAYRAAKGKGFEFHYQLCSIGPEYETPEGKEASNPMLELLDEYAREVKNQNFLGQHARTKHPTQLDARFVESTYVGSDKCKKCHEASYDVWKKSPHAHAYETLVVRANRPSLRQYDPECLVCHVTGLNYRGGFRDEVATANLKDNGCENCHGPASMHVKNPNNADLYPLMNPFKTQPNENAAQKQRRINALDQSCQKCHDQDNDNTWDLLKKWPKIAHKEPKQGGN
jgi:hypothetical protein